MNDGTMSRLIGSPTCDERRLALHRPALDRSPRLLNDSRSLPFTPLAFLWRLLLKTSIFALCTSTGSLLEHACELVWLSDSSRARTNQSQNLHAVEICVSVTYKGLIASINAREASRQRK